MAQSPLRFMQQTTGSRRAREWPAGANGQRVLNTAQAITVVARLRNLSSNEAVAAGCPQAKHQHDIGRATRRQRPRRHQLNPLA